MGLEPFDADPPRLRRAPRHDRALRHLFAAAARPARARRCSATTSHAFRERTGRDVQAGLHRQRHRSRRRPTLQPHILDVGFVSEQEKHEAMAGAVAFIHPSVNESLGIVLLEAWLARTPGAGPRERRGAALAVPTQRRRAVVPALPRVRGGAAPPAATSRTRGRRHGRARRAPIVLRASTRWRRVQELACSRKLDRP